jgi:phage terminase small subunit
LILSVKHERFCAGIAAGMNQTDAYVEAGYNAGLTATANASRLLTHAKIKARIKEMQTKASVKAEVTLESMITDMQTLYDLAVDKGDLSTAKGCKAEIIKLVGLYAPVKTENKTEVKGSMDVNTNQLQNEAFAAVVKQARDEDSTTAVH